MNRKREPSSPEEIDLYPSGIGIYLLATLSMVIAHACLVLSAYVLFVMPIPDHEESAGLIMLVAAASLFLIIHPSFMITRGGKSSLRFLKSISALYVLLFLAWFLLYTGTESVTYFAALGMILSGVGFIAYRGQRLEQLRSHYAELWGKT